jgi:glycosyltransferase involved in cell wall biosynthesis
MDRITVSLPYYRCKPFVRRAVQSILTQTHRTLTLVVVNDGDVDPPWDELSDIDDPRLVRFGLARNRGRYFADAVVLEATRDPYFMVQDADDWSDKRRCELLLRQVRVDEADAAFCGYDMRFPSGAVIREGAVRSTTTGVRFTQFIHETSHWGLFKSVAVRDVGGYYGGFRVGYDTLITHLVTMTSKVTTVDESLYHYQRRRGSLTTSARTGLFSRYRRTVHQQLTRMYESASIAHASYLNGCINLARLKGEIRRISQLHVSPDGQRALAREASRLSELLRRDEPGV